MITNILKIYILDPGLKELYERRVIDHNAKLDDNSFPDAGFDLLIPQNFEIPAETFSYKIPLRVKCGMFKIKQGEILDTRSFYVYPRSSMGSQTPLRLANSVGIIDSGYRGEIIAVFDNIDNISFHASMGQRLVQICTGNLQPFFVQIVDSPKELLETKRGENGFGSSGS